MRRLSVVLAALLVSLLGAGGADASGVGSSVSGITVYAAASLTDVFPKIDSGPKYSFGASSTLAAQIIQGAPADVFASANTTIPDQLFAKGLVQKPVVFTRNGPSFGGWILVTYCVSQVAMLVLAYTLYRVELAGKRLDLRLRELRESYT